MRRQRLRLTAILAVVLTHSFLGFISPAVAICNVPTVTALSPATGSSSGGTSVTITGTGFSCGATLVITFGSTRAVFQPPSATQIVATSPPGLGTVDVTVTTEGGTSPTGPGSRFAYTVSRPTVTSILPNGGPATGGTVVAISGNNFTGATAVNFGSTGAALFTVLNATLIAVSSPPGSGTVEVTVTTPGGTSAPGAGSQFTYGASTVVVEMATVPADSVKAKALQTQVAPMVAQNAGVAITAAIGSAIGDAFAGGGNPVTAGPNGMTFNFTAEPRPEARRTDDAFTTLAYAARPDIVRKAPSLPPIKEREWSLWADLRGTGWNSNNSNIDLKGSQLNLTAGVGYKLTPDMLVGAIAGYEHFKYDSASLAGGVKGSGGTFGSYVVWRFAPALRWDVALAWSSISYDAAAATATGSFTGQRWLAATRLTGSYRLASLVLEPSAKVYALWERQGEWTDSLGTHQSARNFAAGQVATGGKVIVPWETSARTTVAPYVGLYGDWRYMTDDATPAGQPVVGMNAGWSGRVTGGISVMKAGGGMVVVGGEYGGLGANFKMWTANGRVVWPF